MAERIFLERLTGGLAAHAFFANLQGMVPDANAFFQRLEASGPQLAALGDAWQQTMEATGPMDEPPIIAAAEAWLRFVLPDASDEFITDGRFTVAALYMEAAHRFELELAVRQLMDAANTQAEADA